MEECAWEAVDGAGLTREGNGSLRLEITGRKLDLGVSRSGEVWARDGSLGAMNGWVRSV